LSFQASEEAFAFEVSCICIRQSKIPYSLWLSL
jgi:hypothetical protein